MENDGTRRQVLQDNIDLAKRHVELKASIANLERGIIAEEINLAKIQMSSGQFNENVKKTRESLAVINREIADTHQKYVEIVRKSTNSHNDVLRELNLLRYGESGEVGRASTESDQHIEAAEVAHVTIRQKKRNVNVRASIEMTSPNGRPKRAVARVNYKELSGSVKMRRE